MATRVFLALSALLWLPYGVFCFLRPTYLAEAAGVTAASATATVELRAMYGGLQAVVGLLAALGLVRPTLRRPALLTLAFLCAGLGLARFLGAVLAGELSAYTGAGLAFELTSATVAAWCLSRDA
jgi:hypothetical protein